jgi:hypothetical protein
LIKKIKEKKYLKKSLEFVIKLSLIIAIIESSLSKDWIVIFVTSLTFILILTPKLFEKKYKIDIPEELEIIAVIFIYCAIFLGEVHGYYTRFWWWDTILHTVSGIVLGLIGFIILFILYQGEKVRAKPFLIVLFSFCFALALGSIWEIFEFSMDSLFGLNMQKSGLLDTMGDLIANSIGALIISLFGFVYLKNKKSFFLKNIIIKFKKENSKLFKK